MMCRNKLKTHLAIVAAMAGLISAATPVRADIVFSDDFESPDSGAEGSPFNGIPRTSQTRDGTKWVGATSGFGATSNGLLDESDGAFTDPTGEQAYGFRYTNSGVTTAQGAIGTFEEGGTYTVSFDAVVDGVVGFGTQGAYTMELVAFDVGDDNTARGNHQGGRPGTILETVSGTTLSPLYSTFSSTPLTVMPGDAFIGQDIGIRFLGSANAAIIDNVQLDANLPAIPEPASIAIWSLTGLGLAGFGYFRFRRKK